METVRYMYKETSSSGSKGTQDINLQYEATDQIQLEQTPPQKNKQIKTDKSRK